MHSAVEDSVVAKVRETRLSCHEDLVPLFRRIAPRTESAVEGNIRVREQSAADLISGQRRLLCLPIYYCIQIPVYPFDIAPALVVVHQVGHSRPLPHHLSDVL